MFTYESVPEIYIMLILKKLSLFIIVFRILTVEEREYRIYELLKSSGWYCQCQNKVENDA